MLGTVSVILATLLAFSALELQGQPGPGDAADAHHRRLTEAQALASGVLAGADLLLIFILRKLALTLGAVERAKLNERFLVKQSESLRAEYNRLHADKGAGTSAGSSDAAPLRAALDDAQASLGDLQVPRAAVLKKVVQQAVDVLLLCRHAVVAWICRLAYVPRDAGQAEQGGKSAGDRSRQRRRAAVTGQGMVCTQVAPAC